MIIVKFCSYNFLFGWWMPGNLLRKQGDSHFIEQQKMTLNIKWHIDDIYSPLVLDAEPSLLGSQSQTHFWRPQGYLMTFFGSVSRDNLLDLLVLLSVLRQDIVWGNITIRYHHHVIVLFCNFSQHTDWFMH